MLYSFYVCLVTLPLISISTIQFTLDYIEVWLCFDIYIDLTWNLFRRPTFSQFVTSVSHQCHQHVLFTFMQYFSPDFSQKSVLDLYLFLLDRYRTLLNNSRRCYSSNYGSNVMVTSIRPSFRYGPENPSSP